MEEVFYNQPDKIHYSCMNGVVPCRVNMFTPFIRHCSFLFFDIIDFCEIDYALFAGSAIGLYRNKSNIPWVDDFDIVILEDQIPAIPKLKTLLVHYGFRWRETRNGGGIQIYYYPDDTCNIFYGGTFQCDIFYSYFDKRDLLKNKGGWGLYHKKEVQRDWVLPYRYQLFEGRQLPFFNQYLKDIQHEYQNIDQAVIHIQHSKYHMDLKLDWHESYSSFNDFVKRARENTLSYISPVMTLKSGENTYILSKFSNFFFPDLIRRIIRLNAKQIIILDLRFLKYILDLKSYLPKVKISVGRVKILAPGEPDSDIQPWLVHLSMVDEILTDDECFSDKFKEKYPLIHLKDVKQLTSEKLEQLMNSPVMNLNGLGLTPIPPEKIPKESLQEKNKKEKRLEKKEREKEKEREKKLKKNHQIHYFLNKKNNQITHNEKLMALYRKLGLF